MTRRVRTDIQHAKLTDSHFLSNDIKYASAFHGFLAKEPFSCVFSHNNLMGCGD